MASTVKLPAITREFVEVSVTSTRATADQLRVLPVKWAFMPTKEAQPETADWVDGEWNTSGAAKAMCLLGPGGGHPLAAGTYYPWVWIDGAIEEPKRPVDGKVVIY